MSTYGEAATQAVEELQRERDRLRHLLYEWCVIDGGLDCPGIFERTLEILTPAQRAAVGEPHEGDAVRAIRAALAVLRDPRELTPGQVCNVVEAGLAKAIAPPAPQPSPYSDRSTP